MNTLKDGDVLSDLTNRIMLSVKSALKKEVNDAVTKKTADLRETVRIQANEINDLKKRIEKLRAGQKNRNSIPAGTACDFPIFRLNFRMGQHRSLPGILTQIRSCWTFVIVSWEFPPSKTILAGRTL